MSPRKALHESLLEQWQNMRQSASTEEAVSKQNKKKRIDLEPGKSLTNLEDPESEEDSTSSSSDGSTTEGYLLAEEDRQMP